VRYFHHSSGGLIAPVREGARIFICVRRPSLEDADAKRWALLKLMAGQGAMAIREVARQAQRDVRAVHSDVRVLLRVGVLLKVEEGGVVFPYDAIHAQFL
jgi:predicted DNA-binding transcriptional regulator